MFVVAALVSIWISTAAFAVVASIVILLAQAELYATMHRRGYQPATALSLVIGAMMLAGAYLRGEQAMLMFVALGAVLSFLWYMAAPPKAREGTLRNIGSTLLGIVYVPFLGGYALILLSQKGMGTGLLLAVLGLTFLYDIDGVCGGSVLWQAARSPRRSAQEVLGGVARRERRDAVRRGRRAIEHPPIEPSNWPPAIGLALIIGDLRAARRPRPSR